MASLDVDAVQVFVTIAEQQSFTRAAEALGTTQAAISVKLKRLEDRLGEKLIERTPRRVRLSARGAAFLCPARDFIAAHDRAVAGLAVEPRRLAIGFLDYAAGTELPALLARLHAHDPSLVIEARIDSSRHLLDAYDRGDLDAVIVRREDDRRDGEVLGVARYGWFAMPDFTWRPDEPLRFAACAATCSERIMATRALDAAGIAWTEAFLGGGTAAVVAAVSAGLAVAPLAHRVVPFGAIEVSARLKLPPLPAAEILLHTRVTDPHSRAALRTLVSAFREHRVRAG
ncbi:LysR family transcriptional regulator [Roseomonas hellenica]|uniref:LysR family transcriptional regulator n=1 Tax=Plastoroseomonas hellenica TaxID=2687306 RepID=A0ABS5EU41_9PROT|nr:LysR family transcriptional regulator [Plastoroseomonas hellenica]MBR0663815.1 LysR family transcriptional regulator [Plastoroseomonas hellenica]